MYREAPPKGFSDSVEAIRRDLEQARELVNQTTLLGSSPTYVAVAALIGQERRHQERIRMSESSGSKKSLADQKEDWLKEECG